MKDNLADENRQPTADAAEAEKKEEVAAGLQKFKDVQTLAEAYRALEAEFTRRSQRLKELEAQQANKENGAPAKAENAPAPSQEARQDAGGGAKALTPEEKDAVIAEYLNGVFANRGVPFVTGGGAVRAARNAPATLRDAGALAKNFFDKKENRF